MRRLVLAVAAVLGIAACTEQLVTPGGCPELCPGGEPQVRDTLLTATIGGDSAFTGYASIADGVSLPLATGGVLGDSRALIRFVRRGDSVLAGDTLRAFTIDSVVLSFAMQARDTTFANLAFELYRLPASFDSTTTFAELDAAMTPAALLRTIPIPAGETNARFPVTFRGAELDALAFEPADSTRLVIGLRLTGPSGAGVYVGGATSGDGTALYVTYTDVGVADTLINKQPLQRGVDQNVTIYESGVPPNPDLLEVGGFPASRAIIRFALPAFLRDSATIVRATLELVPSAPLRGIAGDSALIEARGLLADIGAKSVVLPSQIASTWIRPGTDTVRLELAPIAATWQGDDALPAAVRVRIGQEFASFLAPRFWSTRSALGQPRLRITYRPPYAVEGF